MTEALRKLAAILVLALPLLGCEKPADAPQTYDSVKAERRTIIVSVESTGVVEPLATVELKSKASGEVLELLVETGDFVQESDNT